VAEEDGYRDPCGDVVRSVGHGAQLPYQLLAGVVPVRAGWLVASAKWQGATIAPEEPRIAGLFLDILDYKPAYRVIAVFTPIGLLEEPRPRGRACEREARRVLGLPRSSAIASAPPRPALSCSTYEEAAKVSGGHLSPIGWHQARKIAEVDKDIAPYWQRTVFEVHPELSFFQLAEDRALQYRKRTRAGIEEREAILRSRLPGVERFLNAKITGISESQLLDAAACLWTARRIAARAVSRLPEDPEWDALGLRMEMVR
jgi:predicted RNase H-like nuclease